MTQSYLYNSCTLYILKFHCYKWVKFHCYREIFKFGFEVAWISVVFKLLGNELKNSPAKLVNAVKVSKSELNSAREMSQFFFACVKTRYCQLVIASQIFYSLVAVHALK